MRITQKNVLLLLDSMTQNDKNRRSGTKPSRTPSLGGDIVTIGHDKYGFDTVYDPYTKKTKVLGPYDPMIGRRIEIITRPDPKDYENCRKNALYPETLDSITAQYTGSLTAEEIAEKWVSGSDISSTEYYVMVKAIGNDKVDTLRHERFKLSEERNLANILNEYNIQLKPDEELRISVDCQNKATVSGINDAEKMQKIQDALNKERNQLRSLYAVSTETHKEIDMSYGGTAECLARVQKYLDKQTGGAITATDLKIQDDKIAGLPPKLDVMLNKPVQEYNNGIPAENEAHLMKLEIIHLLAYLKVHGDKPLPQYNNIFNYKDGKLTCIEQPELVAQHPETHRNEYYQGRALLLQTDPMGYYKLITEAGNKAGGSNVKQ